MKIAKKPKEIDPAYAFVTANYTGFGHIIIHVYDLLGYSRTTLKISCQTGGSNNKTSYAWEYGLDTHSVLKLIDCQLGAKLLRRMDRLESETDIKHGRPSSFAEYATRVLQSSGVRRVHINTRINGGISGSITDLPCIDPILEGDVLLAALRLLEEDLLQRSR